LDLDDKIDNAKLLVDIARMKYARLSVQCSVFNAADSCLLKDGSEAMEVMGSGNEFHSADIIVMAANDF